MKNKKLVFITLIPLLLSSCGFNKLIPWRSSSEPSSIVSSSAPSSELIIESSNEISSEELIMSTEDVLSSEEEFICSDECSHDHSCEESSIECEGISINFLELGNKYTGDCTFIKAGDVDILIDAGSRTNSVPAIRSFIDQYCTDGILEYVIATHAHQDHIAGFVGSNANPGIFKSYTIDTLIDFSLTNSTTTLYSNYVNLRASAIEEGTILHHYTALDCVEETNGASKTFTINESTTMTILDQKFYHENGADENDYSVCTLFTHGENNYLFTGDLEEKGEKSLVSLNELPHCELFKGGHHGSPTSNNDVLLNAITPEVVCICCCAGHDEYTKNPQNQFPSKAALERILKHTDKIYVTTVSPDGHSNYESMNGNIAFSSDDGITYTVTGSNNSTPLTETAWYEERQALWEKTETST